MALYHALRRMGKKAVVYNEDETPEAIRVSSRRRGNRPHLDLPERFEAVFVLDCSELDRVGKEAAADREHRPRDQHRHHISNNGFTEWSIVRPARAPGGDSLRLIRKMLGTVPAEVAVNLYGAIMTDTGSFRLLQHGKRNLPVSPGTGGLGGRSRWIAEKVYETKPLVQVLLLGKVSGTLKVCFDGQLGFVHVTGECSRISMRCRKHTEGFVDMIRRSRAARSPPSSGSFPPTPAR